MPEAKPLRRRTRDAVNVRTAVQLQAQAHALDSSVRSAFAAIDDPDTSQDTGSIGEIWLYGVVGGWWRGFDAESVAKALRGMSDVDEIHVRIHSPGGLAREGVAIANLLRNHKAKVTTIVDGLAASAASVIAVAGDEVVMCPGSQLMIHDASTGMCVWGDAEWLREQVAELQRVADWIDGQSQNYAGVYAYKAGGTAEQWRQKMTANGQLGTWYAGDEAVTAKLADRVGTITAIGSPPVAPEDDWDEDDEEMLARAAHDLQILEQCVPQLVHAAWQGEPVKPPTASAEGSITTEGGSAVAFSDEQMTSLREKLGLSESADETAIVTAVNAVVDESLEERPPAETPQIPEGHVVVPQARLTDLEAGAAAGLEAKKELHAQARNRFLEANKAKMTADTREEWAKEYDANPEATERLFAQAKDLVPAVSAGHSVDDDDSDTSTSVASVTESDAYKNWSFS